MVKKIVLCLAGLFLLTGCCSTRRVDRQVLEYQRQISEYESQLRDRDRTIEDCDRTIESAVRELEAVTTRSEEMGNDFDDVIRELDEYQRAIERCLQELRGRTSEEPEADQGTLDSDSVIHNVSSYRIVYIIPGADPQD